MPPIAPVVLIQADMLRADPEFEDWIVALAPFDAVTMWFTGAHGARQYDALMSELNINSDRGLHREPPTYLNFKVATLSASAIPISQLICAAFATA